MGVTSFSLAISMLVLSVVVVFVSGTGGYGDNYNNYPKPKFDKVKPSAPKPQLPGIVGIQGIIYCKSGAKLIPLQGAVARITCLAVDRNGYELAPFSILSQPADAKGYFLAKFNPSEELEDAWKITECKAFLHNSPMQTCRVPTDVNHGLGGQLLASYSFRNTMKLYSLGPFVYTSAPQPKPISKGY